ncbi:ATP-binding protein [Pseudomonas oryzihabitans]|uniref:ATP-binding protein n=1 Tax=Pseudomonas oryzihabitans TaxID=47885 RepID=UPI0011A67C39|nr:ATP-binding protein [Pseudomonas oryzihabitans]
MNQFCLLSYKSLEDSVPLFDDNISGGSTNVTIVIGPNGSGKSRILSCIVDEFCFLNSVRIGNAERRLAIPGNVQLKYRLNNKECTINRTASSIDCFVDGELSDISEIPFPKRVAVLSHLPADRFRFSNREDNSFYRYLGLRQATNLTTTKALETKVLQSLISGYSQPNFAQKFDSWLKLAGFKSDVIISMELATGALLSDNFDSFKDAVLLADRRRGSARDRLNDSSIEDNILKIWSFFEKIRDLKWSIERRPSCAYTLSHLLKNPLDASVWVEGFDLARRWRLFHSIDLAMSKPNGNFLFSSLSSGEQQLIGNSARLLSELNTEALIIIDEPEVSLHPEWQIKYIPTLRECLSEIPAVHVIIATHSHFMVSDLDPNTSSLVTTSAGRDSRATLFDGAVYGRSPENILYRVFGVATSGNSFIENDLYRALKMISNSHALDLQELKSIYNRLNRVRGEDNIAMNVILDQVKGFIEAQQ